MTAGDIMALLCLTAPTLALSRETETLSETVPFTVKWPVVLFYLNGKNTPLVLSEA